MATTHIEITISTQKEVVVHVLPCHIAHDGPSNVDAHFNPRGDADNSSICTGSFRGRKLRGRNVPLPNQYSGYVLQPAASFVDAGPRKSSRNGNEEDEDDDIQRLKWESTETFDALTVWEHHVLPDAKQDHWIRAVQEWIIMANAVNDAGYDIISDADAEGKTEIEI